METELLFSYGTLKDGKIQNALLGKSVKSHKAVLKGWSLFASETDGYLFIKPDLNGEVKGTVLEIEKPMIHTLDQWEEIPFYKREKVELLNEDKKVQSWVYTRRDEKGELFNLPGLSLNDPELVLSEAKSFIRYKKISNLPLHDRFIMIPCESLGKFDRSLKTDDFTGNLDKYSNKINRYLLKETSTISEIKDKKEKLSSRQRIKTYLSFNEMNNTSILIIPVPLNYRNINDFIEEISFMENKSVLKTDRWLEKEGLSRKGKITQLIFVSEEEVNLLPHYLKNDENIIIHRVSFNKTYEERFKDYASLIVEQEIIVYSELN